MGDVRLTKHHGLGNDFLVLLDPGRETELTADLARALCDRRRGVGADGFIRVTPGTEGADVTMELRNADGGSAEMSGNGIRCLG
ncbi:MAG: diaminopimelate epimerase, partial [Acidimicrobiia bacterium]|nr:diaminopimelate epimerase [Acidimicrobiia bacterium]